MTSTTAPLCPSCSGPSEVRATRRSVLHPGATWRRRRCLDCGHLFSTTEAPEDTVLSEAFIIELYLPEGTAGQITDKPFVTVVADVAAIGAEIARLAGPRTYPATIHHWKCRRAVNGDWVEWSKEKTFQWP